MKSIYFVAITITIIGSIAACNKSKLETKNPSMLNFKPGSYWIYQQYQTDLNGVTIPTQVFDSCYVGADTLINNVKYHNILSTKYAPYANLFFRDSMGYLIDQDGEQIYSPSFNGMTKAKFIISGNDTISKLSTQMFNKDRLVVVPAGIFKTSECRKTYDMFPGFDRLYKTRSIGMFINEDIGIIQHLLPFYLDDRYVKEMRLVRYSVKK